MAAGITAPVRSQPNSINGHEYVDLGLSVKRAMCNVGAGSPEQYGDYYAWGVTEPKVKYIEDYYETSGEGIGGKGRTDRDVAHVKWGGTWRRSTTPAGTAVVGVPRLARAILSLRTTSTSTVAYATYTGTTATTGSPSVLFQNKVQRIRLN